MSGIYIHIPFCRQKCYYCDFYKTVNTSLRSEFLQSLHSELIQRKAYLDNEKVETIYFGGGTPSVLEGAEIAEILDLISGNFDLAKDLEITLEANPDDLTPNYLGNIFNAGINRLSIGIQSFEDNLLQKMNRRHNALQAIESVQNAVKTGINNISVDLIYGLPGLSVVQWKESLKNVFQLPVDHLSAYHLTYHEGTAFYTWLKRGSLKELSENESRKQYDILIEEAVNASFEQYEISNFAKKQRYSQHNSAYWSGKKYLGLGPSAHSYNQVSRRWNVSHVEAYVKALKNDKSYFEEEVLNEDERYNEYVLTRIRTTWGVNLERLKSNFGSSRATYFKKNIGKYIDSDLVKCDNDTFTLSAQGFFVSDEIMSDLMII